MRKTFSNFNAISLIALAILLALPFIVFYFTEKPKTIIEVFARVSLVAWTGLYTFFWLKFKKEIQMCEKLVRSYQERKRTYQKIGNVEYLQEELKNDKLLTENEITLIQLKQHYEFVDKTLKISVIITAAANIILFIILSFYNK